MLKSAYAAGIAWGLGLSCMWAFPLAFAHFTGTGLTGFVGAVIVILILTAAIAEVRARKKSA